MTGPTIEQTLLVNWSIFEMLSNDFNFFFFTLSSAANVAKLASRMIRNGRIASDGRADRAKLRLSILTSRQGSTRDRKSG